MKIRFALFLTALAASGAGAAQPMIAGGFAARIIAAHNRQRAAVRLPPVVWDDSLAIGAAAWAQRIASTGMFEHSNRRLRPGVGENLWSGTHGAYNLEAMIGMWASEKRNLVRGVFPNVSRTGNWSDVSHYTQVIWPATQRIGCALAPTPRTDYLVCRYSPAGNIDGRAVP